MVILHSYVSLPEGMKAKETRPFGPDGAHALKAQTSSDTMNRWPAASARVLLEAEGTLVGLFFRSICNRISHGSVMVPSGNQTRQREIHWKSMINGRLDRGNSWINGGVMNIRTICSKRINGGFNNGITSEVRYNLSNLYIPIIYCMCLILNIDG